MGFLEAQGLDKFNLLSLCLRLLAPGRRMYDRGLARYCLVGIKREEIIRLKDRVRDDSLDCVI